MDWKGTQTAHESHAEREAGDAVEEVEVGGGDAVRDADVGGRGRWRPDVGDVVLPDHAVPKRESTRGSWGARGEEQVAAMTSCCPWRRRRAASTKEGLKFVADPAGGISTAELSFPVPPP